MAILGRRAAVLLAAVALTVSAGTASGAGLAPRTTGYGDQAYAIWRAGQGLPDASGSDKQALYFQKLNGAAPMAAGMAIVTGLEGEHVSALVRLGWERRADGHCDGGAPRWAV